MRCIWLASHPDTDAGNGRSTPAKTFMGKLTHEFNTLVAGRAITGVAAFV